MTTPQALPEFPRPVNAPGRIVLAALFFLLTANSCGAPGVSRISFCDDYEQSCTMPVEKNHEYTISVPEKKSHTWKDLAYHMYFHTRQTPGLRVDFRPRISPAQVQALKQESHCEWKLSRDGRSVEGHLEGRRVDEDGSGVWCFDYLGTMLIDFQKKHGSLAARPDPSFFPAEITLRFKAPDPALSAELTGSVHVVWTVEGEQKK